MSSFCKMHLFSCTNAFIDQLEVHFLETNAVQYKSHFREMAFMDFGLSRGATIIQLKNYFMCT